MKTTTKREKFHILFSDCCCCCCGGDNRPLQIGEKILLFFPVSFSIPFWRWISFTTKKNYNKTTILSSFFSRFPRVCVCVCDETTENPFPACVYYTMPGTLLICQQKCRHREGGWNNLKKKKKREELLKRRIFFFYFSFKTFYISDVPPLYIKTNYNLPHRSIYINIYIYIFSNFQKKGKPNFSRRVF